MTTMPIYNMTDTWNAIGTTFNSIMMDTSDGASGFPVGAAASQLINLKTNGTQRFGVRSPHFALGTDVTPFLNMADIWNTSGAAVGLKYNVTDTASAVASLLADLQVGGTSKLAVIKTGSIYLGGASTATPLGGVGITMSSGGALHVGAINGVCYLGRTEIFGADVRVDSLGIKIKSTGFLGWSADTTSFGTLDLSLFRDAANTLALRNSTTAQKLSIYNTFTDASNYERGVLDWATTANTLRIGTEKAGTGTARDVNIVTPTRTFTFSDASGNFGAPTNIANGGGNSAFLFGGALGGIYGTNGSDGVFRLLNAATNDFGRLCFGLATSSFPAIKRSTTGIEFRLADDSTGTWFRGAVMTVASLPTAASVGDGGRMYVTDATALVFGTTVAGSGSVHGPIYSDGTQWKAG